MAQCRGRTKKGDRCKRDARDNAAYCAIHQDQEIRRRTERTGEWDQDAIITAAIGFALVGVIFFFRLPR